MRTKKYIIQLIAFFVHFNLIAQNYNIKTYAEFNLGTTLGQCRAVPVTCEPGSNANILFVYGEDEDIDPFMGMFYFPTNTLKFAMYSPKGKLIWKKELNRGNIPGTWFIPVFPFDLNQDGKEEIWFVHNSDSTHPLDIKKYKLECLDPATGKSIGTNDWNGLDFADYTMSQRYRHFILGGYDHGQPVLVTAQGTYTTMQLQGWNQDMTKKWDLVIAKDENGSRSSHSCAVVDINHDGSDEFFYGEHCINVGTGKKLFTADEYVYNGHSDVVSPLLNITENKWYIFTARESGYGSVAPPRVVMFKDNGRRLWSALEIGHMDMGWVARIGEKGTPLCLAVKIGGKSAGPKGFYRTGVEEYLFEPYNGKPVKKSFSLYEHLPIDINGDGIHELIGSGNQADGKLLTNEGKEIADFGEDVTASVVCKFLPEQGEQIVLYYPDGTIRIVYDKTAKDNNIAKERYSHPYYRINSKLTAVGYNINLLGGI